MPKKHQPNYSKISASRTYSTSSSAPAKDSTKSTASVNQLLNQLRREQTPQAELEKRRDELTAGLSQRTIPPALRRILNIPETEGPPPRVVRPRRIPGPKPPRSWLEASRHAVHSNVARDRTDPRHDRGSYREFGALALLEDNNVTLPAPSSLLDLTLKTLARNWESLIEVEQYYIPALPNAQLKSLVLAYIGAYGDEGALDIGGIKLLFAGEDAVAGGTGGDDLRLMDLSNLLSPRLTLPDLNRFFSLQPSELETRLNRLSISSSSSDSQSHTSPVESWECEADHLQLDTTSLRTSRFSNLTRLSLFNPGAQASWPHLLRISSHFSQLTHLSLGYWPAPSATPNALTTSIVHRYGRPVNLGGTHFHSLLDNDWYEAANILRRFSKNTYCLKWLDLEGCDWAAALAWGSRASQNQPRGLRRTVTFQAAAGGENATTDRNPSPDFDDVPTQPDVGPDWNGVWRQVEYINLSQGWVPTDTHMIRQMPAGMLGVELLGYLRECEENDESEAADRGRGTDGMGRLPGLMADERSIRHWIEREKESRRAVAGIRGVRAREGGKYVSVSYGWSAPVGVQRRSG